MAQPWRKLYQSGIEIVQKGYTGTAGDSVSEETIFAEEQRDIRARRINCQTRFGFDGPANGSRPSLARMIASSGNTPSQDFRQIMAEINEDEADGEAKPAVDGDEYPVADDLIGLGLSGGGIRSSSFCLGVIQALLKLNIFHNVDYLSTVSGGGFIGSSISSLYTKNNFEFTFSHQKGESEPEVFRYLRNHANYLIPHGLIDVLRAAALTLRGILINLSLVGSVLILAATAMALFLSYLLVDDKFIWQGILSSGTTSTSNQFIYLFPFTALALVLFVAGAIFLTFYRDPHSQETALERAQLKSDPSWEARDKTEKRLGILLAVPIVVFLIEGQANLINLISDGKIILKDNFLHFSASATVAPFLAAPFGKFLTNRLEKAATRHTLVIVGLVSVIAFALAYVFLTAHYFSGMTGPHADSDFWTKGNMTMPAAGIAVLVLIVAGLTLNINRTSLHDFYRDRLSKSFLFHLAPAAEKEEGNEASQIEAPSAGLVENEQRVRHSDRLRLSEIGTKWGPYPLINTAINADHTQEAYQKGRRADFFLFSPKYIGSEITGYCVTTEMEEINSHINLGTAMAISGAAASPSAGRHVNRLLGFVLALLNVRLNYWLPNPKAVRANASANELFGRKIAPDKPGPIYLFREMLGLNRTARKLVNLSDGGHIENMGLNQLLRRKCKLIIISDGEMDEKLRFSGFLEALRIAQIDLGARIDMNGLDEIRNGEQSHAVGTIHYGPDEKGMLLYLKSSLKGAPSLQDSLGTEAFGTSTRRNDSMLYDSYGYISQYRADHPTFPHESTADQVFDERQFECYRALGFIVAMSALRAPTP